MKKLILAAAAWLALTAVASPVSAEVVALPAFEQKVLPNYVLSDQEVIFQIGNNIDSSVDTFHVDIVNRRWTRFGEDGAVSGTWSPSEDVHFSTANPKSFFCLAGPWAVSGCIIAVPVGWAACNAGRVAAIRSNSRECARTGRGLEVTNTGVCGQNLQSRCITLRPIPSVQEP